MRVRQLKPGPNGGVLVRQPPTGWFGEVGAVPELPFVGDVAIELPSDSWSAYTGPVGPLVFSLDLLGEFAEQRVRSYLIPANGATGLTIDANLNVNIVDPYVATEDYLLVFAFYSGRVLGTARQVVAP